MISVLLAAFAADPTPTPVVHVHVDGTLSPAQARRLERQLGSFVVVPTIDLLHPPASDGSTWTGIQLRLDALKQLPVERSVPAWVALRTELEALRRARPPVLERTDLRTRLELELWILRAARGSLDEDAEHEARSTIAQLLHKDRTLLEGLEGTDSAPELGQLADGAAAQRFHPVRVGDVEGVRWLGTVLPVVDGVVQLPEGQWDLEALRAGARPGWSTQVRVDGPVDLQSALDRVVQEELRPALEPGDCHPALPPAAVAWFNVPDRSGVDHFVVQENLLFRVDELGVHRIDRRCRPAPGTL